MKSSIYRIPKTRFYVDLDHILFVEEAIYDIDGSEDSFSVSMFFQPELLVVRNMWDTDHTKLCKFREQVYEPFIRAWKNNKSRNNA